MDRNLYAFIYKKKKDFQIKPLVGLHTGIRVGIPIQSMGTEPHTEDSISTHRPLPSVDLALLPHERRAARIRNSLGIGLGLFLIGSSTAFYFLFPILLDISNKKRTVSSRAKASSVDQNESLLQTLEPQKSDDTEASDSDILQDNEINPRALNPMPLASLQPVVLHSKSVEESVPFSTPNESMESEETIRRFGNARGFKEGLLSAGASSEEADDIIDALEKILDFRRCQPDHELVFKRDINNKLVQFEYRASTIEVYRVARTSQGKLQGHKVDVPIEKHTIAKGGYVSKSLRQALDAVELGVGFAGIFVEVFEGRIDFKKDTREEDSFKAIVDKEYINGDYLRIGTIHALEYDSQRKGKLRAFWYQPRRGQGDFYDVYGRTMQGGWLRTPVRYDHISSKFNRRRRHPILKRIIPHLGIDYAASPGTTVTASAEGVVTLAGYKGANGNLIALRHENGYETFYAHLLRIFRGIRVGVRVQQRQPIGSVGSTGRSTGPHLHFGLKRNGRFIDPETQLNGPGKLLPTSELVRFRRHKRKMVLELEKVPLSAAPQTSTVSDLNPAENNAVPLGSESL